MEITPYLEELFKVKVSSKGQIVIPKPIREAYGFKEGEEILLIPLKEGVLLKRPKKAKGLRGLLKELDVDVSECEKILAEAKQSLFKGSL
ncbi:MAG: AbrB/MazE/SpoVT family DNA-binding domain-containing protein [Thermoprotei archaeon]|nr:MAG: AbrB/MazE/SpoVT family DNA-binding domain-containing protein [Thermoprotei archaeon]RLE98587.1 MAG: AbrB/MazE/SpoVT family DNA-binding domain-containing protein [Thermoprotei archaeon]